MNVAFCTCVGLGLSCLEKSAEAGHRFELLLTLDDDVAPLEIGASPTGRLRREDEFAIAQNSEYKRG